MKTLRHHALAALALLLTLSACGPDDGTGLDLDALVYASSLSEADEALLLDFVNYPGTDFFVLDKEVPLDRRAAENIVLHRNGPDGLTPSADDRLFENVEELLAIRWVGPVSLDRMRAYAAANPPPAGELVEGVRLRGWQSEAIVWAVNRATPGVLRGVGLNSTQANNLVANAPYESVLEMGQVPQIGPVAIERLRYAASHWWHAYQTYGDTDEGGEYAGVHFDGPTAEVALEIANLATRDELVEDGGMWSTGATRIVENRPYADLQEVADTWGIGPSTMQSLHDFAASGLWPPVY